MWSGFLPLCKHSGIHDIVTIAGVNVVVATVVAHKVEAWVAQWCLVGDGALQVAINQVAQLAKQGLATAVMLSSMV